MAKKIDASKAGKKGGAARAKRLTPKERSEIARKAAAARWSGAEGEDMPRAVCGGTEPLRIGEIEIPCYVLEDERRVITLSGMQVGMGMSPSGGSPRMAAFADAIADNPSMGNDLSSRLNDPIEFVLPKGGVAKGYEATLLADICDAVLEARKRGRLTARYTHVAEAAEALVRGFAVTGIIALVDEATGYEQYRKRLALAEVLNKYLADKLQGWTKTFPDEFYEHLFRLKGWDYEKLKPGDPKPAEIGTITKEFVYRRLHPGIVEELERMNPYVVPGKRRHKHHAWLTRDIGHPALKEHVAKVVTVMKLSDDWLHFERNIQRALPIHNSDTAFFDQFFDD